MWAEISILPEAWNDISCLRELSNILFIIGKIRFNDCVTHFKLWERIDLAVVVVPALPGLFPILFRFIILTLLAVVRIGTNIAYKVASMLMERQIAQAAIIEVCAVILHLSSLWVGNRSTQSRASLCANSICDMAGDIRTSRFCNICIQSLPSFSVLGVKSGQIFLMSILHGILL